MSLLVDAITFILIGYLSLTNGLATQIEALIAETETPQQAATLSNTLTPLPSQFSNASIPNILLENSSFQQANVIGSGGQPYTGERHTVEEALVNIYCTMTTDTNVRTTTGSGFFVSPQGAILTNAHVAQFLLLEQSEVAGDVTCTIRHKDPAEAAYIAELLYIPPSWITAHANLIDAAVPKGTGERDYALLYVSRSLTSTPLPAQFPFLRIDSTELNPTFRETPVVAAGYPATSLYEDGSGAALRQAIGVTNVNDLFTFNTNTADLMSLRETPASAGGSSGGPILNETGDAIGVIVTRGETTDDSLRALTTDYISRTIAQETRFTLGSYLSGDPAVRAAFFQQALAPYLRQLLEWELAD